MRRTMNTPKQARAGFTLVELMMVIAIIAVLVGLTLTGINAAVRSIKRRAIALEVAGLAQAVDSYKLKYGEYPPDGSNSTAFEAHFRSAFPNILQSEFDALKGSLLPNSPIPVSNSNYPLGYMDPAEALVFCLGGFSNDPTRPFTGPGGPLGRDAQTGAFIYNPDRNNGVFDFDDGRLIFDDEMSLGTRFQDGTLISSNSGVDLMPVYTPRGLRAPYVYFSSSTYSFPGSNHHYFNHYSAESIGGVARPYKSELVNRAVAIDPSNPVKSMERRRRYINEKSFQIVSAGLDDDYGGYWDPVTRGLIFNSTPAFFVYPSGKFLNISGPEPQGFGYVNPSPAESSLVQTAPGPSAQLDNVTNFSEGPLESSLP